MERKRTDRIHLERMEFFAYHGVLPEENRLGQRFYVDVILELDLRPAGESDRLELTVNYADVYEKLKKIVEKERYKLIEALAERIASALLDAYTIVNAVTVRVVKPHPPFDIRFSGVAVEIYRKREHTDEE